MDRVLAGALVLAVSGAVFTAALAGALGTDTLGEAVGRALWPSIVLVAVATVLTWLLVRDPAGPAHEPDPEQLAHHQHHRRFHL
jgi:hypothetical protein